MAVHLAKGTRDFLPSEMIRRERVIGIIREVFLKHGFEPLETPAFERIETLLGKYGEEGDKLVFKILKRGEGAERGEADMALRYDLTVPFARVLAMNPDLRLPFKRYQMQPVWRADRPQRGRFREFWQCDVDVAGSTSPLCEAECLAVASEALAALGFTGLVIQLNDRKILRALASLVAPVERETEVLVALDKLDKIGRAGVTAELVGRGFDTEAVERLWDALEVPEGNAAALDVLEGRLDPTGREGVARLREVLDAARALGVPDATLRVTPTLARGLDYYTGPVYELVVEEPKIGALGGGGRYDGLIGQFSGRDVPAVGIALGLERIVAVMEELGMLPDAPTAIDALVTVYDPSTRSDSLQTVTQLREAGVRADLYLGDGKLKAQFKYANARGFPWLVVIGPKEAEQGLVSLKDLTSGSQVEVPAAEAARRILAARAGTHLE